tara:strand:+ start:800 stop:1111 length:312 start_codon:yes stop_codon:yes gene_type:complete
MAIIDLSITNEYPSVTTTASVPTTQQAYSLPSNARKLTVGGIAASYLIVSGVSDGAAVPTDKISIPANQLIELELPAGNQQRITTFAAAAQAATTTITVILEA